MVHGSLVTITLFSHDIQILDPRNWILNRWVKGCYLLCTDVIDHTFSALLMLACIVYASNWALARELLLGQTDLGSLLLARMFALGVISTDIGASNLRSLPFVYSLLKTIREGVVYFGLLRWGGRGSPFTLSLLIKWLLNLLSYAFLRTFDRALFIDMSLTWHDIGLSVGLLEDTLVVDVDWNVLLRVLRAWWWAFVFI